MAEETAVDAPNRVFWFPVVISLVPVLPERYPKAVLFDPSVLSFKLPLPIALL